MKKKLLSSKSIGIIVCLFISQIFYSQTSKTVSVTHNSNFNKLNDNIQSSEYALIEELVINGTIDARDLNFINIYLTKIKTLNLSNCKIEYYGGNIHGKLAFFHYPENEFGYLRENKTIETIILPSTIKTIDSYALESCSNLKSINLENITSIGSYAFSKCINLENITLSSSLEIIGESAFERCTSLSNIILNEGVKTIGEKAFSRTPITQLNIPNSVSEIKKGAFSYTKISSIDLPLSISHLSDELYLNCDFTSIIIPSHIESIGEKVFAHNLKLKNIDFSLCKVSEIPFEAFLNCGLESLSISDNIKIIGENAFSQNNNLISVDTGNGVETIRKGAFSSINSDFGDLGPWADGYGKIETIVLGTSVTVIENFAFYDNENLKTIISKSIVPPTCGVNSFKGLINDGMMNFTIDYPYHFTTTSQGIVQVPSQSLNTYKNSAVWQDLYNDIETLSTKIYVKSELFKISENKVQILNNLIQKFQIVNMKGEVVKNENLNGIYILRFTLNNQKHISYKVLI